MSNLSHLDEYFDYQRGRRRTHFELFLPIWTWSRCHEAPGGLKSFQSLSGSQSKDHSLKNEKNLAGLENCFRQAWRNLPHFCPYLEAILPRFCLCSSILNFLTNLMNWVVTKFVRSKLWSRQKWKKWQSISGSFVDSFWCQLILSQSSYLTHWLLANELINLQWQEFSTIIIFSTKLQLVLFSAKR